MRQTAPSWRRVRRRTNRKRRRSRQQPEITFGEERADGRIGIEAAQVDVRSKIDASWVEGSNGSSLERDDGAATLDQSGVSKCARSYTENVATGRRTLMRGENGVFALRPEKTRPSAKPLKCVTFDGPANKETTGNQVSSGRRGEGPWTLLVPSEC